MEYFYLNRVQMTYLNKDFLKKFSLCQDLSLTYTSFSASVTAVPFLHDFFFKVTKD